MLFSKSSSRLEDCRQEKLVNVICTVGSSSRASTAPLPPATGGEEEEGEGELSCSWCLATIQQTIEGLHININSWFSSACRRAVSYMFEVEEDGGGVCSLLNGYIADIDTFVLKFLPLLLCKHWGSCSTQEAIAFASNGLQGDLPCEECHNTRNVIRSKIARMMKNEEDTICFLTSTLIGSSIGCNIIKLDSNGFEQVAENLLKQCPVCEPEITETTTPTPATATESVVETNATNMNPIQCNSTINRNDTFLLHFFNVQSEKCLKYQKDSEKVQVTHCNCFLCQPGERDETTFQWFRHGSRIVSSSEGLVLEATEENQGVILAPYDELQTKQEWHFQALDEHEPERAFIIINGFYQHLRLSQIESSYEKRVVDIGIAADTENSDAIWNIRVIE